MYDTILVPTDGSEGANAAARHAVAFANAFDGQVHVLSIIDERAYSGDLASLGAVTQQQQETLQQRAANATEDVEALVTEAGIDCRTAVERGVPHEEILAYADEHGVDLVSMGTHGRTGLDRLLLGSVTERVVRTSDVPVLTSRLDPDSRPDYDRLLLPTDGSEAAAAAVEHALAVAERTGAALHVLSVVDLSALTGSYDLGPGVPDVVESLEEEYEHTVAQIADRGEQRGVDVLTEVTEGSPFEAIRDYVDEEGMDLVVMGTHGRTGLERYLIGSVTERVVRAGEAPVLTVR